MMLVIEEQAATKSMNEEQTAPLQTALLHPDGVRAQMRTAQQGSIPSWLIDDRATKGYRACPLPV